MRTSMLVSAAMPSGDADGNGSVAATAMHIDAHRTEDIEKNDCNGYKFDM